MLVEMDLETTMYVTGIAVVFLQSMYFDYRLRQVHKKLDKVTEELADLRHLEQIRRNEMGVVS
jgi:hypothetical protein